MPNLFLDLRSKEQRQGKRAFEGAACGAITYDGEIALKVQSLPMKFAYTNQASTTLLTAKPGIRYLIHSASITMRNDAGTAATGVCSLTAYLAGSAANLLSGYIVPSAANTSHVSAVLDVLTDVNQAVAMSWGATAPLAGNASITYQEIPVVI